MASRPPKIQCSQCSRPVLSRDALMDARRPHLGAMCKPCATLNTHDLKTLPAYFVDVWHRVKTFEIRKDDRGFRVGDILNLKEWDGGGYTGRVIVARVTYKINDPEYCKEGYCVLGIVTLGTRDDGL